MTAEIDNLQSAALEAARSARLMRLIEALPKTLPQGPILDLGAGTGAAGPLLKARYMRDIEAVDQDGVALEQAAQRSCYSRLHQADLIRWEPEYPYALIHAAAVLHQTGNLEMLLGWFRQCLVDGGVLAFSLPRNQTSALAALLHDVAQRRFGTRIAPLPPAEGRLEDLYAWLAPHGEATLFSHEELRPLPVSQEGHPLRLVMEESFIRPMLARLAPDEVESLTEEMDEALEQAYPTGSVPHVIRLRETYAVLQLSSG